MPELAGCHFKLTSPAHGHKPPPAPRVWAPAQRSPTRNSSRDSPRWSSERAGRTRSRGAIASSRPVVGMSITDGSGGGWTKLVAGCRGRVWR